MLTVRGLVLATPDPALAAEGWLDLAHGLVVTDPDAAMRAAAEAAARGAEALGDRWAEAVALCALLGEGEPPDTVSDGVLQGRLLLSAARLATSPEGEAVASGRELLQRLAEVEAPCREHALRWVGLAERAAGWARLGDLGGPPVVLDTLRATVAVADRAPVSFAGSRRRFDLLLALARRPDQGREALFEEVWGHRWQGAASRNALQATVSRTRQALGDAVAIEVAESDGYRLSGGPTVWVRGPIAPVAPVAEATALIGRTDVLARLRGALTRGAWVGLSGPPGVGKSRLAREATRHWPGRVIRVDLRGTSTRAGVLDALAERLATHPDQVGEALRGRAGTLVVLDDLDDLDDEPLDDLLHAWRRGGTATTVLTTHRRHRPSDHALELRPLSVEDAAELIVAHAGGRSRATRCASWRRRWTGYHSRSRSPRATWRSSEWTTCWTCSRRCSMRAIPSRPRSRRRGAACPTRRGMISVVSRCSGSRCPSGPPGRWSPTSGWTCWPNARWSRTEMGPSSCSVPCVVSPGLACGHGLARRSSKRWWPGRSRWTTPPTVQRSKRSRRW
ncbi:MAG: winged helix-turn-helix domain-containing protein [Myxococcales bacterium]|nr:winged helix-turn-helix domain-containing protein [Myxococcales bacterium]